MRRDLLLIAEMIDSATRAQELVDDLDLTALMADRTRRDALLWNFTVLGEAAAQLEQATRDAFPEIPWQRPIALRNPARPDRRAGHASVRSDQARSTRLEDGPGGRVADRGLTFGPRGRLAGIGVG